MPDLNAGATPTTIPLPPELVRILESLPPNVDRRTGADLLSRHLFPVSHRTLEAWPLPTRRVNGKAVVPTVELFRIAHAMLAASPVIMGGRHRGAATEEQRAA
jgi:hypothetical protein